MPWLSMCTPSVSMCPHLCVACACIVQAIVSFSRVPFGDVRVVSTVSFSWCAHASGRAERLGLGSKSWLVLMMFGLIVCAGKLKMASKEQEGDRPPAEEW